MGFFTTLHVEYYFRFCKTTLVHRWITAGRMSRYTLATRKGISRWSGESWWAKWEGRKTRDGVWWCWASGRRASPRGTRGDRREARRRAVEASSLSSLWRYPLLAPA